jgi:3-methylcrotonyl-CoA carboxylase alpha subunit
MEDREVMLVDFKYDYGGRIASVKVTEEKNTFKIDIDDVQVSAEVLLFNEGFLQFSLGNKVHKCVVSEEGEKLHVFFGGKIFRLERIRAGGSKQKGPGAAAEMVEETGEMPSPISGKVIKILITEGEEVKKKQPMMIMESMKMEYKIRAPFDGVVKKIHFKEEEQVEEGQLIIVVEKKQ